LANAFNVAVSQQAEGDSLWGLRFRRDLMHDGNSPGTEAAIARHGGEATTVRQHYDHLRLAEKQQILMFLNSL